MSASAVVKLYAESEADANETAAWVRAEGLDAVIEPPEVFDLPPGPVQKGWAVRVEGEPDAVLALGERMRENLLRKWAAQ